MLIAAPPPSVFALLDLINNYRNSPWFIYFKKKPEAERAKLSVKLLFLIIKLSINSAYNPAPLPKGY